MGRATVARGQRLVNVALDTIRLSYSGLGSAPVGNGHEPPEDSNGAGGYPERLEESGHGRQLRRGGGMNWRPS